MYRYFVEPSTFLLTKNAKSGTPRNAIIKTIVKTEKKMLFAKLKRNQFLHFLYNLGKDYRIIISQFKNILELN